MARQQEQRVDIPPSGGAGVGLGGVFAPGDGAAAGGAVIAPPHPLYGGSLDDPVVEAIAEACRRAGLAALRFDWRGVGASAGDPSGAFEDAEADTAAALAHLAQHVGGPLVAGGYSFGAAAAVRAAAREPRVRSLVLVAPPPSLLDAPALAAFPGDALLVAGELDRIAPPDALRARVEGVERCALEVIARADHFFGAALQEVGRRVGDCLRGALS